MIKLLEPSLKVMVRKEDYNDINGCINELENQYSQFMKDKTGRDEYNCTLTVFDQTFLTDERDEGCGGVIIFTEDERIVC